MRYINVIMRRFKIYIFVLALLSLAAVSCSKDVPDPSSIEWIERPDGFSERYALEEMVVLSRHNIRSPLSGGGSVLARITPHKWFEWTSAPSELSVKGGELEAIMGRFFREWLVMQNIVGPGKPAEGQMRFYSNSMQRTIATTSYFLNGLYPSYDIEVETHAPYGTMDPVFNPQVIGASEAFTSEALSEISAFGGSESFAGIGRKVSSNFKLLEEVLDMKNAPAAANDTTSFNTDDVQVFIKENAEPSLKGGLKMATSAADALVLQYYEETDDMRAGFGHKLAFSDWEKITAIKDWYEDVLFTAPSVAKNIAQPLLKEILSELQQPQRRFTFLCGHDSNLCSVMAALDCNDFDLRDAVEKKTPVGGKLIFEKWTDSKGAEYADILLVYASAAQLRNKTALSLSTPPSYVKITMKGLEPNADGLYPLEDLIGYIEKITK